MALLRVLQDCEYRPEHDILIVGDTEGGGPVGVRVGERLNGRTSSGYQVVRLGGRPRAGVVGPRGEVVVWREGEPVEIARWSAETVSRAFGTPHGIVLCGADQIVLVHTDGGIQPLGTHMGWWSAVDPAGRL